MQGREPARRELLRSGQQMAEFALLIGLVTAGALAVQFLARQSVQTGLKTSTDTILGAPPAPEPPDPNDLIFNETLTGCGGTVSAIDSQLVLISGCANVVEQGNADFERTTTVTEHSEGISVNQDTRLQTVLE